MDYSFQHIHKQEQRRNLERNIQSCGMQVIRGRNPPPPPPSCWESKHEQEVSVCVCELPPLPSSYRQLQVCGVGHLDSETCIKWTSHTASHYARVQHLFSDRGWCSMNTAKNQLLVTDDPVEVQDFRKITDHSRESVEYISTS